MSTAPKTEVAFIQENQNKVEHSALFYLFQEVSKLDPPVHTSFLDTHSPSKWLNEMSRKRHFNPKDEDEYSLQASRGTRKYRLSCVLPCDREENGDASESDEPRRECSSPWKVLSLINLTCERLLHQNDVEEENSASESPSTRSCRSAATSASAPPNGTERESEGPKKTTSAPVEDLRLDCAGGGRKLQFCVKDAAERCDVQQQPAGKTDPVTSEMQEDCSVVCSQPLDLNQRCNEERFSTKKDQLDVPFPDTQNPTCLKAEMTSGYSSCVYQSKPALTLDHNANITLSPELSCDTQLLPLSAAVLSSQTFTSAESRQSPSGQASTPRYHQTSTEDAADRLTCSSCDVCLTASTPELWTEQTKEPDPPPPLQRRAKTRRKQPRPSRSADVNDPDFQGVMFRMDAELDDTREQCRLLITSKYSKELCKAARKLKPRARTSQKSLKTSSSDEENDLTVNAMKNKVCASCCTRKTPMWRDAEDGTPLCNACGIRYKKYRVRCVKCWHIPRKEGNSNSRCLKCGNFVKPSQQKLSS